MRKRSLLFLIFAMFVLNGCTSPTDDETENEETSLQLSVEAVPEIIPADGISETVIFVEVLQNGNYVPDSTQVLLFQTMGRLKGGRAFTFHGVALDTLVSDTLAGTASVIAYVEGERDTIMVIFAAP